MHGDVEKQKYHEFIVAEDIRGSGSRYKREPPPPERNIIYREGMGEGGGGERSIRKLTSHGAH